ncbi:MAG: hypothetical protein M1837_005951 [Sclerophora amabilis]|nr:MAG: hypothetical protein M1837_005951 [Sclerophora amabilis]
MLLRLRTLWPTSLLLLTFASAAVVVGAHEHGSVHAVKVGLDISSGPTHSESKRGTSLEFDEDLLEPLLGDQDPVDDEYWKPILPSNRPYDGLFNPSPIYRARSREALARAVRAFFETIQAESRWNERSIEKLFLVPAARYKVETDELPLVTTVRYSDDVKGQGAKAFVYYKAKPTSPRSRKFPEDYLMSVKYSSKGGRQQRWEVPDWMYNKIQGKLSADEAASGAAHLILKDSDTREEVRWEVGYYTATEA